MVSKKDVRISQCMIVKNEEENIERALSWGKGLVSEQIVVDTGSTDRTAEIARHMGARVYEFLWKDDFAAAKNFAISKARYGWIAFLDADEYLAPGDKEKVQNYVETLQDTQAESLLTLLINLDDDGNVMSVTTQNRIFKRHLRYEGRIHEHLVSTRNSLHQIADVTKDVTIYHTGYGAREWNKKSGRNLKLILLELKDHPSSYEMWAYLGQEYMDRNSWEQAETAFKKAVELMPEEGRGLYDITLSVTLLRLLNVQINKGADETELLETYQQAIAGWPEEADYDYVMAQYFSARGNWEQAEKHLKRSLDILETYGTSRKSMLLAGNAQGAYELLAMCCYNNGNLADAVRYTTVLLKENPYLMSTLTLMLRTFSRDPQITGNGENGARQIITLLGTNFYDFTVLKDRLFVLQAARTSEYQNLIQVIRELFSPEELDAVDRTLGRTDQIRRNEQ